MPVGEFVYGIILGGIIRGPGYLICRAFKNDIDPESAWVLGISLLFWVCLIAAGLYLYGHIVEALAVDRCLDAGGAYDYQAGECVYR